MNTSKNKRYQETEERICQAFTQLLSVKGYSDITVHDICTCAQISRPSFYAHYEDINDMIIQMEQEKGVQIQRLLISEDGLSIRSFEQYFCFLKENRGFYTAYLTASGSRNMTSHLMDTFLHTQNIPPSDRVIYIILIVHQNQRKSSLLLCLSMALTACGAASTEQTQTVTPAASSPAQTVPAAQTSEKTEETVGASVFANRDLDASYSESDSIAIVLNGNSISCNSGNVLVSGSTVTISEEGTYVLSGTLEDGSVIVDAEKTDKIQLVLSGVSIHSQPTAPIYVRQADKVFVTLASDTKNSLSNGGSFTADGDTNIDSVIFSKDDLTLNGSGALTITSPGGHGIVSKDSLRVTGGSYAMDVSGHGLSGQDEVSIANGIFDIVAGKDGIHAENSEDADAGFVYLENGTYRITAGGDGISASGSCQIVDGDYTITTGGGSETVQRTTSSQGFGRGQFGGSTPTDRPQFDTQSMPERGAGGKGGMGGKGMDRMNQMPANGQNTAAPVEEADTISAKGIKASSLTIQGGNLTADCADDALHSNGNLIIQGGTLELASCDDGIHADETVTILSGNIQITDSYEGIEGQLVYIQGGDITLNATDDGLNAAGGMDGSGFGRRSDTFTVSGDTPSIVISGGTVNITSSADGIDANGIIEMTGGNVTVCGPTQGDTSILDYDASCTISGGTFIGTGASGMTRGVSSGQGTVSVSTGTQSAGRMMLITAPASVEIMANFGFPSARIMGFMAWPNM